MQRSKKSIMYILLCMSMLMVVAIALPGGRRVSAASGNVLYYGISDAPVSWDPIFAWDSASYDVLAQITEGLFAHDYTSANASVIPRLVSNYNWSSDAKTLDVTIRSGVTFQDGTPLNAAAVKWNFDRMLWNFGFTSGLAAPFDTDSPSVIAQTVSVWQCLNGTQIMQPVQILNSTAVRFQLNTAYSAFTSLLAFQGAALLSPSSTPEKSEIDVNIGQTPVGTGPFMFDTYVPADHVYISRYSNYWRGAAAIDGVYFSIISDPTTRNEAMLNQTIDILPDPLPNWITTGTFNVPGMAVHGGPDSMIIQYISMNNEIVNRTMREALSYAYNYTYHLDEIMQGLTSRLRGPIPNGMTYYNSSIPYVTNQNLGHARQVLVDAGLANSSMTESDWIWRAANSPIAIYNYTFNAGNAVRQQIGDLLVACATMIGVRITTIMAADWASTITELMTWDLQKYYPLVAMGWGPDFNDPNNFIQPLFTPESGSNFAHVNDPVINQAIVDGLSATTTEGRQAAYNKIANYTQNGLYPWIFTHQIHQTQVWSNRVSGYTPNSMTLPYFYLVQLTSTPDAPEMLVATPSDGQVSLSWNPPTYKGGLAITGYIVYIGTSPGAGISLGDIGNVTSYTATSLTNGQTYYFTVAAVNAAGAGANATEVSATPHTVPGAPGAIIPTPGNTQVTLSWSAPGNNGGSAITGYNVYGGTTSGSGSLIEAIGNVTTYTATGLANGQTYYFTVAAVNAAGAGANATEVSATPHTVPGAPLVLVATSGVLRVVLSWQVPVDNGGSAITGYNIFRSTTAGNEALFAVIGNVSSYTDTGLSAGQPYYYQVSAINDAGNSVRSAEATATPTSPEPEPEPTVPGFPAGVLFILIAITTAYVLIKNRRRYKR